MSPVAMQMSTDRENIKSGRSTGVTQEKDTRSIYQTFSHLCWESILTKQALFKAVTRACATLRWPGAAP